jgi:predicted membrane protein
MDITITLSLLGTAIAIIVSAISAYISIKKFKPEIQNTNAGTEKITAETIKISAETISSYALELKNIKEDTIRERVENEKRYDDMACEIDKLNIKIRELTTKQEVERSTYRTFINELLFGITRLTGQIQATGQPPVWLPPKVTPFEQ